MAKLLLGLGLLSATFGAALCPFIWVAGMEFLIGFLGLPFLAVALILLIIAGIILPVDTLSYLHEYGGLLLYFLGAVSYILSLHYVGYQATRYAIRHSTPSLLQCAKFGIAALLPSLMITLGLRYRNGWEWRECRAWGITTLSTLPVSLVLFWLLSLNCSFG